MFGKKKPPQKVDLATGIDIGNFAVKVVQMSKKEEKICLDAYGYSRINADKLDGVSTAIKEACEKADLSHKKVNVSINPEGVIVRYLVLPEMSDEDLRNAMKFEIERYVPFEKTNVVCDYMVLNRKSNSKNMKVLLVAAKKDNLERRVQLVSDAGLEAEVMTVDSIVLRNPFQINYPEREEKTIGLLNIGSKLSNINIICESASYFMRDIQLGGDNITQLLKEKLDINLQEAEKVKYTLSVEDKDKLKIIEPVLGNLLNEVYLSFDYFESEFGMAVDEIFVSGGTARLAWLVDFLKENLNREITIFDPILKIECTPSIKKEEGGIINSSLVVPIGLALESFN